MGSKTTKLLLLDSLLQEFSDFEKQRCPRKSSLPWQLSCVSSRQLVGHRVKAGRQSQRPNLNRASPATSAMSCKRLGLSLTSRREASPPCLVSLLRRGQIQRHCLLPSLRV